MKKQFLTHWIIFSVTLSCIYSCEGTMKKNTPKEFLNHTVIQKAVYSKDSLEIIKTLKKSLLKQKDFFNNSSYSGATQLIIDSIIYSSDFNRLAVFLVTKNHVDRQLAPNQKYKWYYDATCYLGIKQKDIINLSWIGPSFTNSYDKKELSNIIRDSYFTDFATKEKEGLHSYKYNLNDIRFWNSSIWKEIEEDKIKKQEFEDEKRMHPENIYEPH